MEIKESDVLKALVEEDLNKGVKIEVLIELLIEKGVISKEEFDKGYKELMTKSVEHTKNKYKQ